MMALKLLDKKISDCKRCDLWCMANNRVPGEYGSKTKIVLIGEGPGVTEDKTGVPFTGLSGILMRTWLDKIGMKPGEYSILNIVKCRAYSDKKDRPPMPSEIAACQHFIEEQIKLIGCKRIVALGKTSADFLIENGYGDSFMGAVGKVFKSRYGQVLVMPHPAYVLRNHGYQMPLDKLRKFVDNSNGGVW